MLRSSGSSSPARDLRRPRSVGEKATADGSIIGDRKEFNVHGTHLGSFCYAKAIDYLYRGVMKHELIATTRLPLREFQNGIDDLLAGKGVKIGLDPSWGRRGGPRTGARPLLRLRLPHAERGASVGATHDGK